LPFNPEEADVAAGPWWNDEAPPHPGRLKTAMVKTIDTLTLAAMLGPEEGKVFRHTGTSRPRILVTKKHRKIGVSLVLSQLDPNMGRVPENLTEKILDDAIAVKRLFFARLISSSCFLGDSPEFGNIVE
jgi:hypothetical protein